MWPFNKKVKHAGPNPESVKKLKENELPSQEQIEKQDAEFREESGFLITKVMKKSKKL